MNFLDRNEFNFKPSQKVIDAIKNFDPETLCFYTRIYDEGKKSIVSVRLSEIYNVPEEQVLLGYGGEDILKNAVHYYLMKGDNKTSLYRNSRGGTTIASQANAVATSKCTHCISWMTHLHTT